MRFVPGDLPDESDVIIGSIWARVTDVSDQPFSMNDETSEVVKITRSLGFGFDTDTDATTIVRIRLDDETHETWLIQDFLKFHYKLPL